MHKFWRSIVVVTAAATLTLTACSAGGGSAPNEGLPEAPTLSDSGQELDQVTVAFPGSLANLYIGQEGGIFNYNLAATVQEGLVALGDDGQLVPALAESWETPDSNTYVFKLRDDALFHTGEKVTVEDVLYSLEMAMDPEASPSGYYYMMNVDSFAKTGDNELTVKTINPDAGFLVNLSNAGALVVSPKSWWEEHNGQVGTSKSLLVGTGPYKVTEFQPDSHAVLERVDTWWGDAEPKVKTIRFSFISDSNTMLAAAQKGDIDIAFNVPINQVKQWSEIANTRIESVNDLSYVGFIFDQSVAPFDDVNVRKAVSYAIDREAISEKLLRGFGEPATAIMTPDSMAAGFDGDEARELLREIPQYDYNIDSAKAALEASSVPGGFQTELTYPNTGPQLGIAAQAIAESLKEIGIQVSVREIPLEEWLNTIGDGEHGLGYMWYLSTTPDPSEINGYLIGPENPNAFESEEAEELLAGAMAIADPQERILELIKLETLSANEAVNAPIWWGKSVILFNNRVGIKDFAPNTFTTMWGPKLFAAEQ